MTAIPSPDTNSPQVQKTNKTPDAQSENESYVIAAINVLKQVLNFFASLISSLYHSIAVKLGFETPEPPKQQDPDENELPDPKNHNAPDHAETPNTAPTPQQTHTTGNKKTQQKQDPVPQTHSPIDHTLFDYQTISDWSYEIGRSNPIYSHKREVLVESTLERHIKKYAQILQPHIKELHYKKEWMLIGIVEKLSDQTVYQLNHLCKNAEDKQVRQAAANFLACTYALRSLSTVQCAYKEIESYKDDLDRTEVPLDKQQITRFCQQSAQTNTTHPAYFVSLEQYADYVELINAHSFGSGINIARHTHHNEWKQLLDITKQQARSILNKITQEDSDDLTKQIIAWKNPQHIYKEQQQHIHALSRNHEMIAIYQILITQKATPGHFHLDPPEESTFRWQILSPLLMDLGIRMPSISARNKKDKASENERFSNKAKSAMPRIAKALNTEWEAAVLALRKLMLKTTKEMLPELHSSVSQKDEESFLKEGPYPALNKPFWDDAFFIRSFDLYIKEAV